MYYQKQLRRFDHEDGELLGILGWDRVDDAQMAVLAAVDHGFDRPTGPLGANGLFDLERAE